MVTPLWFEMHCVENGFTGVGRKNCQVVGADHNLKLDPNGLFKVAALVWIFRGLMNSAGAWAETAEAARMRKCDILQDTCKDTDGAINAKTQSEAASIHTVDDLGWRERHLIMLRRVLPPDGGPQEVRPLPRCFFPLWPGNYSNLPSSCATAPVQLCLGPPLWLHYQHWSSLMAQSLQLRRLPLLAGLNRRYKDGGWEGWGGRRNKEKQAV